VFGIDQISVDNDVKDSAAPFDQIRFNTRRITNRVRQTGGLRGVVSLHAVGNADFHPESSVIRNIDCQNLGDVRRLVEVRVTVERLMSDFNGRFACCQERAFRQLP
jgi:hypothetical protein